MFRPERNRSVPSSSQFLERKKGCSQGNRTIEYQFCIVFRPERNCSVPSSSQFLERKKGCSQGNGTIEYQFCIVFRPECNRSDDMFSICLFRRERNGTIAFHFRITCLVFLFSGTERFYLKRFFLNTALQRFTFRNNTERSGKIASRVKGALIVAFGSQSIKTSSVVLYFIFLCSLHTNELRTNYVQFSLKISEKLKTACLNLTFTDPYEKKSVHYAKKFCTKQVLAGDRIRMICPILFVRRNLKILNVLPA